MILVRERQIIVISNAKDESEKKINVNDAIDFIFDRTQSDLSGLV